MVEEIVPVLLLLEAQESFLQSGTVLSWLQKVKEKKGMDEIYIV